MASPPPRVWSLATSFSCSVSRKLALERGLVPGWVCAWVPVRMQCAPAQELSPAARPAGPGQKGPPAGPTRPAEDCLCFRATSSPVDVGCCFGRLPRWRKTLDYRSVLIVFALTCVC
ncbi:unnamed protein product [Rangifer tarandus platyrhynchus]|uniref:Uncharacterized protein n=1 Tax=Rangifer tarandus platyrhynchus TaxID=3082113 RepID=A0AC59Y790_RANTA